MKLALSHLVLGGALVLSTGNALAAPIFFNDRALFLNAMTTTGTVDFEGVCNVGQWCTPEAGPFSFNGNTTSVGGIDFSVDTGTIGVSDANAPVSGSPYNSSLLFSNNNGAISGDTTGLGSITAFGGWFGDITGSSETLLTLFGLGGSILDTQIVTAGDMGLGNPETFYGWVMSANEVITGFTHSTFGAGSPFEGVDDIVYGTAGSTQVPEPGPLGLLAFGLGLLTMRLMRRKTTT